MGTYRFINLWIICVIGFFISCTNSESTQDDIEQTIIALEREALDQWSKGNPSDFPVNFSEDATYFDDIAAQSRQDGIEEIRSYFKSLDSKITPHTYEIVDPKVQVYDDIVILTLRYNSKNEKNEPGKPWKATSIYQLKDKNWKVVHANWSLIKEE